MQAREIYGASQQGEGGVVERFMSFRVAPAFDGKVGEGGAILGSDDGEKCMHGRSIFESKGVASVENWLGLGKDGSIEKEDVGHKG